MLGRVSVLLLALLGVSACASFGPTSVDHDRFDYVQAIAASWKSSASSWPPFSVSRSPVPSACAPSYYQNEPMTQLDKALFAFASYNAGPGRVRQLRQEAIRRGLDPNVWFQNVEYVAAEKIGQETVTYVANIYKYYIGFRLVLESQAATKEAVDKVKTGSK